MGGGGSSTPAYQATGTVPNFDYQTAMGLQQLAVGGDIQSYSLSDQDFANRYPALQQAYQTYQANLGQQVGQTQQGYDTQSQLMGGLANQIAGRQATGTTGDINDLRNAAATAQTATQPMYNLGASQAGLAQPLIGMGNQMARTGQQITGEGGQVAQAAQTPYSMGQQLLNEPVDPQTQQQMMRAGLSSAAGSMGAASLGQGMAGQSAAARQLGLSTLQYGQQMRGEGMADINQYSSMMGAAGQMQGLGASTVGSGAQTIGLGGTQMNQAAQTYGAGANTAATTGGLYGSAQNMQEQYGMDTANMANIYGGLQSQQAQNLLGSMANANQMFQKRSFGLGGTNLAQSEMGQSSAYNSFQQANYATMNGIAYNGAQMQAQQNQLQAQQQSAQTGMLVSTGTTAAVTGATIAAMSCWVAQACYPDSDKWKIFRHWLMNKAPRTVRRLYLRHGQAFAVKVRQNSLLRAAIRLLMDQVIERTTYVYP
jgi:hypothetical protein